MPLNRFEIIGDWSIEPQYDLRSGFERMDTRILFSHSFKSAVQRAFERLPMPVNLFFLHDVQHRPPRAQKSLVSIHDDLARYTDDSRGAITVVYTHNYADNQVRLSPWILAHRLSHAICEEAWTTLDNPAFVLGLHNLMNYMNTLCGNPHRTVSQEIRDMFTFRSSTLDTLQYGEIFHEAFAQFVITGSLSLNRLSTVFDLTDDSYDRAIRHQKINRRLTKVQPDLNRLAEEMFQSSIGKILLL